MSLDAHGTFELEPTAAYSPLNAYWLAQCSLLAYEPPATIAEVAGNAWQFEQVVTDGFYIPNATTEFWFGVRRDSQVLALVGDN